MSNVDPLTAIRVHLTRFRIALFSVALGTALAGPYMVRPVQSEQINFSPVPQHRAVGVNLSKGLSAPGTGIPVVLGRPDSTLEVIAARPPPIPSRSGPTQQPWMHGDVAGAWASGFRGQGVTITVVDDFTAYFARVGRRFRAISGTRFTPWRAAISRMRAG